MADLTPYAITLGATDYPSKYAGLLAYLATALDAYRNQAGNSATTAGSSTAYTLTPSLPITAYTAGQTFWVTFHTASGANPTLQISGIASPPSLVRQAADGSYVNVQANDLPINHRSRVTLLSPTQALVEEMPPQAASGPGNTQLAGLRNKIINGKMEIAQRGTSFVSPVSTSYMLDRWLHLSSNDGAFTVTQASDTPAGNEFQNSLRLTVTTADTSIAAGQFCTLRQPVEGFNVRDLIGRTFTLSFRVRSSKTGTHCVAFINDAGDRSYVAEYTVNAANTWETKSITVSGGLITAGTWNWTNGRGVILSFALASGSTFNTTADAWQTGNFLATSSQVNCLDTVGNIFAITGVQLEVGSVATPFEHRPIGLELGLCQRYFEIFKVHNTGVAAAGGNAWGSGVQFKATKRATPTLASLTTDIAVNISGGTLDQIDIHGCRYYVTATAVGVFAGGGTASAAIEL